MYGTGVELWTQFCDTTTYIYVTPNKLVITKLGPQFYTSTQCTAPKSPMPFPCFLLAIISDLFLYQLLGIFALFDLFIIAFSV